MKLEILEYLPEVNSELPPLIFIHGANHGAWCWQEHFLPYFFSKGFPCYALSFRGHGGSEGHEKLHSFSLADYMDDVLETMKFLKNKPVLIGHSMGGAVVQKLLHLYPDKIIAAVLIASIPPNGMLRDLSRLIFTRFKDITQMVLFLRGKSRNFPGGIFFSEKLPVEKTERFVRLLQPESTKARNDFCGQIVPAFLSTNVPMLVLGSRTDWFFPEKTTIHIGKAYNAKTVIFPFMCHDMMLDPNWKMVADQILVFLNEVVVKGEKKNKKLNL